MNTVAEILERYEREAVPELAPRTQRDYKRHIAILCREFGSKVAAELRPRDFAAFLDVRGRGRVQRVRTLAVLSAAFTQAVSTWYVLEHNVLRDVKRFKSKPRDRLILDREFEAMKALSSRRIKLAMMLALMTAQRQGDILSFKWSDITETEVNGKMINELNVLQSKTGKRIAIEISPELEAVLDQCWLLPGGGGDGSDYLIPTRSGSAYTSEGFRAMWQRAMKRFMALGNENFHFHDIRALAATKCATPEIAMRLLGHTTLAMTMRVYRRGVERVQALKVTP